MFISSRLESNSLFMIFCVHFYSIWIERNYCANIVLFFFFFWKKLSSRQKSSRQSWLVAHQLLLLLLLFWICSEKLYCILESIEKFACGLWIILHVYIEYTLILDNIISITRMLENLAEIACNIFSILFGILMCVFFFLLCFDHFVIFLINLEIKW